MSMPYRLMNRLFLIEKKPPLLSLSTPYKYSKSKKKIKNSNLHRDKKNWPKDQTFFLIDQKIMIQDFDVINLSINLLFFHHQKVFGHWLQDFFFLFLLFVCYCMCLMSIARSLIDEFRKKMNE